MAKKEKSVIEEALLEAEQIDTAFNANAKEILTNTMGSEIEELVKESLTEDSNLAEEELEDDDMATDLDMSDDTDLDVGGELALDLEDNDDEVADGLDLGGLDDIDDVVDVDADDVDIDVDLDGDDLGDELGDELDTVDLTGVDDTELVTVFKKMGPEDEIEVVQDGDTIDIKDNESGAEYRIELGGSEPLEDEGEESLEDAMEESVVYEVEIDEMEDMEDMDYMEEEEDIEEGSRNVQTSKSAYRTGNRERGTDVNSRRLNVRKSRNESVRVQKVLNENKALKDKLKSIKSENKGLKENHENMVGALKTFRQKLQEVALFNSNLTYAVRLFTEEATTKDEKLDIIKSFDEVKTLKESKAMYKTLAKGLSKTEKEPIKESIENKVNKTASSGSSQISEQSVYIHPELEKMKNLWEFDYKY